MKQFQPFNWIKALYTLRWLILWIDNSCIWLRITHCSRVLFDFCNQPFKMTGRTSCNDGYKIKCYRAWKSFSYLQWARIIMLRHYRVLMWNNTLLKIFTVTLKLPNFVLSFILEVRFWHLTFEHNCNLWGVSCIPKSKWTAVI